MKKLLLPLSVFLILFLTSCGADVPVEIDDSENIAKLEQIKQDSLLAVVEKAKQDSINALLDEVKVSLYKHSGLDFDMDGFCYNGGMASQPTVREVSGYHEKREFKASAGVYVQKVKIEGNVGNVNIEFTDNKDNIVHKIEDYTLDGSLSFSTENLRGDNGMTKELKERDYANWFSKAAKIVIQYKDSTIFEGVWRSNGRYRQF